MAIGRGRIRARRGPAGSLCSPQLEGGNTVRWIGVAAACGIAGAIACAGPAPLDYVPASEHSVDLYAELPPAPSGRITNGEDALTLVLRDEALLRHLKRIDANYSGRRRE